MPDIKIPINGPSYQSPNIKNSNQDTINLFPEFATLGTERTQVCLQPLFGHKLKAAGSGKNRGACKHIDELYVVNGSRLYKYDSNFNETDLVQIPGSDPVDMASDRFNLVISTGSTTYNYTSTLAALSDVDWNNARTVKYFNDRFVFDTPTGYGLTDIQDPTTVNALNTAGGTSNPDLALGVYTHGNKFYPYGKKSIESWWNTGQGNPPAARETYTHKLGPIGTWAVDSNKNYSYMLASDKGFYRVSGVSMQSIDNPAISREVEKYSTLEDCRVVCMRMDGQEFVWYIFPTANRSWFFHEPSNFWGRATSGLGLSRHALNSYVECYNKKLIVAHDSGNIYELDPEIYTDNGAPMRWVRTTPGINAQGLGYPGKNLFFESVEYTLKTGDAPLSGQGSSPKLMHRFSVDDGVTWTEEMLPIGARGNTSIKVNSFSGMGMIEPSQNLIIQVVITDPLRWSIIDCTVGVEVSY